jgi:hypothetical protein
LRRKERHCAVLVQVASLVRLFFVDRAVRPQRFTRDAPPLRFAAFGVNSFKLSRVTTGHFGGFLEGIVQRSTKALRGFGSSNISDRAATHLLSSRGLYRPINWGAPVDMKPDPWCMGRA